MTIWQLSEWVAWALSAIILLYLVTDAVRTSRAYDEEFLTHTLEDLGDLEVDSHGRVVADGVRGPDGEGDTHE